MIPPYSRVINYSRFCQTEEEFHATYGLSLVGIDPAILTDKMISDVDWLSVYKVPRATGKVKVKHVRPELYDQCMVMHQKVYQEIPVNYELSVSFARAFAYENCTTAKQSMKESLFRVAWALAAEVLVERRKRMGILEQRIQRFTNMSGDDASIELQNTIDSRKIENYSANVDIHTQPCTYMNSVNEIGEIMLYTIKSTIDEACHTLECRKGDLEKATLSNATENKVSAAVIEIRNKLESAVKELAGSVSLDAERKIQLQTQIQVLSQNLDLLGVEKHACNKVPEMQVLQNYLEVICPSSFNLYTSIL